MDNKNNNKEKGITYCPYCGSEMVWNDNYTFEDYMIDGDGIVMNFSCLNCEAVADFYTKSYNN